MIEPSSGVRKRDYADAKAALASALVLSGRYRGDRDNREVLTRAKLYAERALGIDDTNVEANLALGHIAMLLDYDWAEAESRFQAALSVSPRSPEAHRGYSTLQEALRNHESAVEHARAALGADPLSANAMQGLALRLYRSGAVDDALDYLNRAIEADPDYSILYENRGSLFLNEARFEEARADFHHYFRLSGFPETDFIDALVDGIAEHHETGRVGRLPVGLFDRVRLHPAVSGHRPCLSRGP